MKKQSDCPPVGQNENKKLFLARYVFFLKLVQNPMLGLGLF